MNIVDLLVILIYLGTFSLAFFTGVVRSVVMLLSLAAGLIGASILCTPVGNELFSQVPAMSTDMAQLFAFLLLLCGIAVACYLVLVRSFATRRLRTRVPLEHRGGIVASLLLVVLGAALAVGFVTVLTQAAERTVVDLQPSGTVVTIDNQFRESVLAGQVRRVTPYLYEGVSDVLHTSAPQILVPVGR